MVMMFGTDIRLIFVEMDKIDQECQYYKNGVQIM